MNEAGPRQAGALGRTGAALQRAARLVAGLMFAGVFLVFLYKIVMRYAFHEALAWGEEVSVILFIWIIFWANAFILRDKEQISFDLLYHRLPPAGRRVTAILRLVLIGAVVAAALPGALDYIGFLWRERTPVLGLRLVLIGAVVAAALPGALDYIGFLWRERTPVLGLRLDLVYSCFGVFLVAVVARSLWGIGRLLGRDWREYV